MNDGDEQSPDGDWGWEALGSEDGNDFGDTGSSTVIVAPSKDYESQVEEHKSSCAMRKVSSERSLTERSLTSRRSNNSFFNGTNGLKGITSSPSFQELEIAIGATLASSLGDSEQLSHENLKGLSPSTSFSRSKFSSTNLTQQKLQQQRLRQQRQHTSRHQSAGHGGQQQRLPLQTHPTNFSPPVNYLGPSARVELSPVVFELESRAIILFHPPSLSPINVRNACSKFGLLYYIRPEFHSRGVTFISYLDLRAAISAKSALPDELGKESGAEAQYCVSLHAINSNSEEFDLEVRNLPAECSEGEVQSILSRYGQLRCINRIDDEAENSSTTGQCFRIEYYSIQDARLALSELSATSSRIWSDLTTVSFAPLLKAKLLLCRQLLSTLSKWRAELSGTTFNGASSMPTYDQQQQYSQNGMNALSLNQVSMAQNAQSLSYIGLPDFGVMGGHVGYAISTLSQTPHYSAGNVNAFVNTDLVNSTNISQTTYQAAQNANDYISNFYQSGPAIDGVFSSFESSHQTQTNNGKDARFLQEKRDARTFGDAQYTINEHDTRDVGNYSVAETRQSRSGGYGRDNAGQNGAFIAHGMQNNSVEFFQAAYRSKHQYPHYLAASGSPSLTSFDNSGQNQYSNSGNGHYNSASSAIMNIGRPQHHNGGYSGVVGHYYLHGGTHATTAGCATATSQRRGRQFQTSGFSAGNGIPPGSGSVDSEFALNLSRIEEEMETRTTIMVRNIPNKYNQQMLLEEVNVNHEGTYDFFYLPIDFKNRCNVGYCFINFLDPKFITPFVKEFNGQRWRSFNSEKVCAVSFARIQGKNAMIARFQNSSLLDKDDEYQPLLFYTSGPDRGKAEPFPSGNRQRLANSHPIPNLHTNGSSSKAQQVLLPPVIARASPPHPPGISFNAVPVRVDEYTESGRTDTSHNQFRHKHS